MKIIQKNIADVIPYARNPRHNAQSVKKVAASLAEFGWQQPIVIDSDNVVVAGHVRLMAAELLEYKKVPVQIADDLTAQQIKAYRIADNRVGQDSDWDNEYLVLELNDLEDKTDLLITGLDQEEIDLLLSGDEGPPEEFPEHDENIECTHTCPKCSYTWSGKT